MARTPKAPSPPRPLPLLKDAVRPELRPLMAGIYRTLSLTGWIEIQDALLEAYPELLEIPRVRDAFSRGRSSAGRDYQRAREQLLEAINGRKLDGLDLAAVVMDGTPVGEEQLLWAVGVTRDGVKVPLGVTSIASENWRAVGLFVEDLAERGLDTGSALWIVDGHSGLRKGIRSATGGQAAIQLCRVHKQRNVLQTLTAAEREEHYKEIGDRLQTAWANPSYEAAAAELEQVARWLEELGFEAAAVSARHDIELTLTLQRLGIDDPELLKLLGSTNLIESANSGVSVIKKRSTTYGKESEKAQRQGAVAVAVAGMEPGWRPIVEDPAALASVPVAVVRGRYPGVEWVTTTVDGDLVVRRPPGEAHHVYPALRDLHAFADRAGKNVELTEHAFPDADAAEAMRPWLERCGFVDGYREPQPHGKIAWTEVTPLEFAVRPLTVPSLAPDSGLARNALGLAAGDGAAGPGPAWAGSDGALQAFGLQPGALTVEQLAAVLTGRHLDGGTVRKGSPQPALAADGAATGKKVTSVMSVAWEVTAPEQVGERWLLADAAGRSRLEQTLMEGAQAGLRHLYDGADVATALAVDRGGPAGARLRVRGVVVGAMRDGKILSPWAEDVLPRAEKLEWARAEAGDIAAGMLDAELARMGPTSGLALPRDLDQPWSHDDYLAVLGEHRAGRLNARVEQRYRDELADVSITELVKRHQHELRTVGDPFAHLDRAGAAEVLTLEQRIAELKAAGRDGPELTAVKRRLDELSADGRHPNRWSKSHGNDAVKRLALERERAARAGAFAQDGGVVHRLEAYREALGGQRLRQLSERALERAEEWAAQPTAWLQERDGELAKGLRRLDLDAARALRDVERTRAELERRPDQGPEVAARLRRLDEVEQGLHLGSRHPDDWLAQHGDAAADRVAVKALLGQRERQVTREAAPARRTLEPALEPRRPQPARAPVGVEM